MRSSYRPIFPALLALLACCAPAPLLAQEQLGVCKRCDNRSSGMKYCPEDGTRLSALAPQRSCKRCRRDYTVEAFKFCPQDGTPLTRPKAAPEPAKPTSIGAEYFPMEVGHRWDYRISSNDAGVRSEASFSVEVTGTREVGGKTYFVVEQAYSTTDQTITRYVRLTDEGVFRGLLESGGAEVLSTPFPLKSGSSWELSYPEYKGTLTARKFDRALKTADAEYSDCFTLRGPIRYTNNPEQEIELTIVQARDIGPVQYSLKWGYNFLVYENTVIYELVKFTRS